MKNFTIKDKLQDLKGYNVHQGKEKWLIIQKDFQRKQSLETKTLIKK